MVGLNLPETVANRPASLPLAMVFLIQNTLFSRLHILVCPTFTAYIVRADRTHDYPIRGLIKVRTNALNFLIRHF